MQLIIELISMEMKDLIHKVESGKSTPEERNNLAVLSHTITYLQ